MKKVWWVLLCLLTALLCTPWVSAETYYVAQEDPKASDQNAGTADAPCKTMLRGLKGLKAGDTLYVKKGVYREEIVLPRKDWDWARVVRPAFSSGTSYANMITIMAWPGDEPVITGSDLVTGWKPHKDAIYVREDWPVNSQQVFCDGKILQQIAGTMPQLLMDPWKGRKGESIKDMEPGSFFYDIDAKKLYVWLADGADPGKHTMEVSVRCFLFSLDSDYVKVSGFKMRHASITTKVNWASVGINGSNNILENCDITWTDFVGLSVGGHNNTIINCKMNYHGNSGIGGGGSGHRFINCETSYNNYRHWSTGWHAGGVKIIPYASDILMTGHVAAYNEGDGIWFDSGNFNVTVENSLSHHNKGAGIFYEISERATIRNNICYENLGRGVYLSNASDCQVLHNLFWRNGMSGVASIAVDRKYPPFGDEKSRRLQGCNNVVWGNLFVDNCNPELCLKEPDGRDKPWDTRPELILPDEWEANTGNISDYNVFCRSPNRVMPFWKGWHVTQFADLAEWRSKTGNDTHSIIAEPLFMDAAKLDFRPAKGSPAIGLVLPRIGGIWDMTGNLRPIKETPDCRFTAGPFEPQIAR